MLGEQKANVRKRQQFIEFQLAWEGKLQRKQLQDQFEISPQQSTVDLGEYSDAYPSNIAYDPRQRAYVRGTAFAPQLTDGDVSEYLAQLEMLSKGYREESEIWPVNIPEFDTVAVHSRPIAPETFKLVLAAIRQRQCRKARYVSLSSGSEGFRAILPHALASDGHRWHVRAFDFDKRRYSDFVLSRLEANGFTDTPGDDLPRDVDWTSTIQLILTTDPAMPEPRRERLESEYRMRKGALKIKIRQAMLFYYLRFYGFNPHDLEDGIMRNVSSFHLKVANMEEVEKWLGRRN